MIRFVARHKRLPRTDGISNASNAAYKKVSIEPVKPSINAGIAASIVSSFGFAAMDALTKQMVTTLSPAYVLLFRSVAILLLFVPLAMMVLGTAIFKTEAKVETAWRSLLFCVTSALIVVALRYLTLAETISIFFICPAVTVLLGAWWLKEKLTIAAVAACVLGFVGVVLIVQPFQRNGTAVAWAFVLPVLAAISGAVQDVLSRKLARRASPSTLLIYGVFATAIGGAVLGATDALTMPTRTESLLLLASAACGVVAFFFVIISFQLAPTAIVAPLRFLNLLWAVLLGYLFWSSIPNAMEWLGISLIVVSGLLAVNTRVANRGTPQRR